MSEEPHDRRFGVTMQDWIESWPNQLTDEIGAGLSNIVRTGRHGFSLEGAALVDFVRRALTALVKSGGRPRHWGTPEDPDSLDLLHYGGDSEDDIVEGVIADWLEGGGGDLTWSDFRFTLPEKHR